LRIAHVVFPRADANRPVLGFVWDAIDALSRERDLEQEILIPLPLGPLRKKKWPSDIESRIAALSPAPKIVPYLPLPSRSIESATAAIALHLLARPLSKRPHLIQGSLLDEAGFAAAEAARIIGAKSIAVAHGSDVRATNGELDPGRKKRALAAVRSASAIVAVSNHLAGRLARVGARAEVVRYGARADRFPLSHAVPKEAVVLFVGNVSRDKGVDVLLEAIALLPGVKLRIVGARADLDVSASDRVIVEGVVDNSELARFYAESSMTVLPSLHEGFGIVLVESLLVGRPVIGSDTGGIREIIAPDTGALVRPGDAAALARAIENVLARRFDPELLRRHALAFTWEENGAALAEVIREQVR
jgi:glycosyltransferase involved in cell wall biosynthesis